LKLPAPPPISIKTNIAASALTVTMEELKEACGEQHEFDISEDTVNDDPNPIPNSKGLVNRNDSPHQFSELNESGSDVSSPVSRQHTPEPPEVNYNRSIHSPSQVLDKQSDMAHHSRRVLGFGSTPTSRRSSLGFSGTPSNGTSVVGVSGIPNNRAACCCAGESDLANYICYLRDSHRVNYCRKTGGHPTNPDDFCWYSKTTFRVAESNC
jgi:hypothetical protein